MYYVRVWNKRFTLIIIYIPVIPLQAIKIIIHTNEEINWDILKELLTFRLDLIVKIHRKTIRQYLYVKKCVYDKSIHQQPNSLSSRRDYTPLHRIPLRCRKQ